MFRRSFATAVTLTRSGEQLKKAPAVTKSLSKVNGITVVSHDAQGPTSSVSLVLKAGTKFEKFPGQAHLLKKSLIRTIKGDTVVRTFLETELRGNSLYSQLSREHVVLSSEFLRDDVVDVVPLLFNNVFNKSLEVYELIDAIKGAADQTAGALADPAVQVFEKLHQTAYRTGLGHSLFATKEALNELTRKDVLEYASQHFNTSDLAVVATGVNHQDLEVLVDQATKSLKLSTSSASVESKYFGGESRIEAGPKSKAIYAVAYPGASYTSTEYAASLVLRALLGGSKHVKYSETANGLLGDLTTPKTTASGFSTSYADAGLVGFVVEGDNKEVKAVAQKSIAILKSISASIPTEAFEAAKKAAVIASETDLNRQGLVDALVKQSTASSASPALTDASALLAVTASDVSKLAAKALASKPSIVARGNLLVLPYADEL